MRACCIHQKGLLLLYDLLYLGVLYLGVLPLVTRPSACVHGGMMHGITVVEASGRPALVPIITSERAGS